MIFAINDDQIGEYGRIEVAIRELRYSTEPRDYIPICSWQEMMRLMIEDGFYPEFIEYDSLPWWFEGIVYNQCPVSDLVKPRIFKKWCKKLFEKYGEPKRTAIIAKRFDQWCDSLSEENIPDFSY